MKHRTPSHLSSVSHSYDPAVGTTQVGYRAISGELPSGSGRVYLRSWALVYPLCVVADSYYDLFVSLFAEVNSSGVVALPFAGINGEQFADMSERVDLIGERGRIWVSSMIEEDEARGGVLTAVGDNLVYLLTLDPYVGIGDERAVYLLEDIVHAIASRVSQLKLSPTADTMGRLPVLQDIGDLLFNTRVDQSWYKVTSH